MAQKSALAQYEQAIFDNAAYFTVITWRPLGKRLRQEFPTFAEALSEVRKPRTDPFARMVYAVTKVGRSTFIAPEDYQHFLDGFEVATIVDRAYRPGSKAKRYTIRNRQLAVDTRAVKRLVYKRAKKEY